MKINNKIKQDNHGFTLLEMTIAMGVFIILFILTLGIYAYALKAEQRTIQISKIQKEVQLITEVMVKKIRNSRLDYNWYTNYDGNISEPAQNEDKLAIVDKSGNLTVFKLKDDGIGVCSENNCTEDSDFYIIPSQEVTVANLSFDIYPASDPFDLDTPPTESPRVIIMMNLEKTQLGITRNFQIQLLVNLNLMF